MKDEPIAIELPSSGYLVYYYLPERSSEPAFGAEWVKNALPPRAKVQPRAEAPVAQAEDLSDGSSLRMGSKPRTDGLKMRVSLIPRLLREILVNPFRDFTLVKRGDQIFTAEKGADLSGKDLSGVDLHRANLEGANLEETILVEANLEDASLKGANLRGADLRGANLRKANLDGAVLEDSNLRGADLWGTGVDSAALVNHGRHY